MNVSDMMKVNRLCHLGDLKAAPLPSTMEVTVVGHGSSLILRLDAVLVECLQKLCEVVNNVQLTDQNHANN